MVLQVLLFTTLKMSVILSYVRVQKRDHSDLFHIPSLVKKQKQRHHVFPLTLALSSFLMLPNPMCKLSLRTKRNKEGRQKEREQSRNW